MKEEFNNLFENPVGVAFGAKPIFKKNKMKEEFNLSDCICGNHNVHTKECLRRQREIKQNISRREQRKKLRAEHRCIICKKKVKPVIVYHQYCSDHKPKNSQEII